MHTWRSLKLFWHNNKSLPPPACTECYQCQRRQQLGQGVPLLVSDIHGCTDVEGVGDDGVERTEFCYDDQQKPVPRPSAGPENIKKGALLAGPVPGRRWKGRRPRWSAAGVGKAVGDGWELNRLQRRPATSGADSHPNCPEASNRPYFLLAGSNKFSGGHSGGWFIAGLVHHHYYGFGCLSCPWRVHNRDKAVGGGGRGGCEAVAAAVGVGEAVRAWLAVTVRPPLPPAPVMSARVHGLGNLQPPVSPSSSFRLAGSRGVRSPVSPPPPPPQRLGSPHAVPGPRLGLGPGAPSFGGPDVERLTHVPRPGRGM